MRPISIGAAVALAIFGSGAAAQSQPLPPSFRDCRDRTGLSWCSSKLKAEGWKLKYQSKSPDLLMDAYWQYDVWLHERTAVLCVFSGGRGVPPINYCQPLNEVND